MLSFVFSLILGTVSWGQHGFGNAGEGFLMPDGTIRLRDFIEAGLQDRITYGPGGGYGTAELVDSIPMPFFVNRFLLAAKIDDLNRAAPAFGTMVLWTMRSFTWQAVNEDLVLLPEECPRGQKPDENQICSNLRLPYKRVPIANRFYSMIKIDVRQWNQLPMDDRVGLLLHEAIFSLIKPRPYEDPAETLGPATVSPRIYQSAIRTREIVATLFSPDILLRGATMMRQLAPELDVPLTWSPPFLRDSMSWSLELHDMNVNPPRKIISANTSRFWDLRSPGPHFRQFCERALSERAATGKSWYRLTQTLTLVDFSPSFVRYNSPASEQYRVVINRRPNAPVRTQIHDSFQTLENCIAPLRSFLNEAYQEL